ncbi:MAG: LD-carboxypeptidase [Acidobacteria bacterium]|nr:LD-carboxypeptidase [Acidobacteriota bacterium]
MKLIIKPRALHRGDTVAIIAPSSNLKADYLAKGVSELERIGFRVKYDPGILSRGRYTAGSDERRADELMRSFTDNEIKAVWTARGGYGSMRLLKLLNEKVLRQNPKIFIGYSDLTALHLYFYRRFGWVTFHGPMAAKDLAGDKEQYDSAMLIKTLMQTTPIGRIDSRSTEMLHRGPGRPAHGRLLGGCLSLISSMMGTPDELNTKGSILFLEDTLTKPFAIDRMLQQLKLAGKFDEVEGIVFGEMTDCMQHADQGYRIQDVLTECTADLGVPVMFGLPSGHSNKGNLTLPLGVMATLDPDQNVLSIDEAAVGL